MSKLKLIYLEWEDAKTWSPWVYEDEIEGWDKAHINKQAAWLLRETPKYLLLAGITASDGPDYQDQFAQITKIPKTWIRKRKVISDV